MCQWYDATSLNALALFWLAIFKYAECGSEGL